MNASEFIGADSPVGMWAAEQSEFRNGIRDCPDKVDADARLEAVTDEASVNAEHLDL